MADGQEQFATLYRAHHGRIVRLCRLLLQDPPEADEVGQDVFLKLLKTESVWDHAIPLESCLTRFAVNACRDRRRSRWWRGRRETPQEFEETDFPSPCSTPEQVSVSREQRDRIWRELRTLSPRQQEVFALRYVDYLQAALDGGWPCERRGQACGTDSFSLQAGRAEQAGQTEQTGQTEQES